MRAGGVEGGGRREAGGAGDAGRGTRDARLAEGGQRTAEGGVRRLLAEATSDQLLAFLRRHRWFGGKATAIGARVRDAVALPWEEGRYVVARIDALLEGGAVQVYQVPLCAKDGALADAVREPGFLRHLAGDLAHGASYGAEERPTTRWVIAPEGEQGLVVPPDAPLTVGSAEQSNTSIRFDDEGILKLFRRLEAGEHPDVELTRYLTVRAGFAHTPTLLGTIRFAEPDGTSAMAGMLQEYLPESVDAWTYALARGRAYFGAPAAAPVPNDFAADAARLGAITREMHDVLARAGELGGGEALAPQPATRADVAAWAAGTKRWIDEALALLARVGPTLSKPRAAEAQVLVSRRAAYLAWVDEIVAAVGDEAGLLTRIHGDYHLGQVLRTASDDFMIIDFEGEPARALEERRRKASPLRDVAGMVRSFAYAAAMLATPEASRDAGRGTRGALGVDPQVEIRAARWEREVREAFLAGYYGDEAEGEDASRVPRPASPLLSLFEAEKAFYELAYELNNRPDWAWIPMRGISKLLVRA